MCTHYYFYVPIHYNYYTYANPTFIPILCCLLRSSLFQYLPTLAFCDTVDDGYRINPSGRVNEYKLLCNHNDLVGDNNNTIKEMKTWYESSTDSNIDRILAVYDEKKQIVTHICSPIHSVNRVFLFDVIIPKEGNKNGYVTIYNYHCNIITQYLDVARMWWSKFFGIYSKEKTVLTHSKIYLGIEDLYEKRF